MKKLLINQQIIETNLEILKKSFSTNGLIAYKIESLVKELEGLVNKYLGELSDGRFTLEFLLLMISLMSVLLTMVTSWRFLHLVQVSLPELIRQLLLQ